MNWLFSKDFYENYPSQEDAVKKMAVLVESLVNPSDLFDVGAAFGYMVRYFRDLSVNARGLDISDYACSRSKGFVYCHDAHKTIPEPENSWDVVVCTRTLGYISPMAVGSVISDMARVAGRFLILMTPLDRDIEGVPTSVRPREYWTDLIEVAGLQAARTVQNDFNRCVISKKMGWNGAWHVIDTSGYGNRVAGCYS